MNKKINNFLLLAAFCLVTFSTACTKKSSDTVTTSNPGSMTAALSGANFNSQKCTFLPIGGPNGINIMGYNGDYLNKTYPIISFTITGYNGVGSYNWTSPNYGAAVLVTGAYYPNAASKGNEITGAAISITSASPDVVGTFTINLDGGAIAIGKFTATAL